MEPAEKIDLVLAAIAQLKPVLGRECVLNRTAENKLDQFSRPAITNILAWLRYEQGVISYRVPGEEKERNRRVVLTDKMRQAMANQPKPSAEDETRFAEQRKRADEAQGLLKEAEFRFQKLPSFENWYEGYLLHRSAGIEKLSPKNFDILYITVQDIEEELQINPATTVSISLDLGRPAGSITETHNTGPLRSKAVTFLQNLGIIGKSKINIPGFGAQSSVSFGIDLKRFQTLKEQIDAAFASRPERVEQTQTNGTVGKPTDTPPDAAPNHSQDVVYELKYTGRRLLLNNMLLASPTFEGENDQVLRYLLANPNRKVTLAELREKLDGLPRKTLHKVVENLRFRPDIKRLFFIVTKSGILLQNPITNEMLSKLKLPHLQLVSGEATEPS